MITASLIIYAFMAGMTAEYIHTKLTEKGRGSYAYLVSLFLGAIWPATIWRMSR